MEKKNQFKKYGKTTVFFLWDDETQQFFKGVAVCSENDEYNEATGKRIARAKAVYKMRAHKANAYSKLLETIEAMKNSEAKVREQYEYWRDKAQESYVTVNDLQANN